MGEKSEPGEPGSAVNVGEGLLKMVVTESLVLFREVNSMVGVGRAWNAVRAFESSSS